MYSTFSGDDCRTAAPFPEQRPQSPHRFKMSPNSAFKITKHSPESVVEICTDSQRFNGGSADHFRPIPVHHVSPSADPREPRPQAQPQTQSVAVVKLSARRRSFAAVRDFTSRVMAPFIGSSAPAAPAASGSEGNSGKTKRLSLNIFQGGLPLFKGAKKLPPIEPSTVSEKLVMKQKKPIKVEQLEKTVQGSSYVPNPVAGDAPEGVFRPTPVASLGSPLMVDHNPLTSDLSMLSPQEQRKQKLYHRSVVSKLQAKTNATVAVA